MVIYQVPYSVVESSTYASLADKFRTAVDNGNSCPQIKDGSTFIQVTTPHPQIKLDGKNLFRLLSLEEIIRYRVEAYESGEKEKLFDTRLDSCTGFAYNKNTTKFKIIPICQELILIGGRSKRDYLSVDYDAVEGSELDSSKCKYNTGLTQKEILEHPGWLTSVNGDKTLLRAYQDIVFEEYSRRYKKYDKLMAFRVRRNTANDELRAVFVYDLSNDSLANGNFSFNNLGRSLLGSPVVGRC